MIAFLSPAKSLDFESALRIGPATQPVYLEKAAMINEALRKKTAKKLMALQNISENLAGLNFSRNQQWTEGHSSENARQAALAFTGDVYQGLQAAEWSEEEMTFASEHLRILSGLYGVLKPTDLVQPYRLEMGTPLRVNRKTNLYAFWKTSLATYLKEIPEEEVLLNLASQEYFKAIHVAKPKNRVIDVEFLDYSKGTFKVISFFAKKARGLMARYIVQNKVNDPQLLPGFNLEGYAFYEPGSTVDKLIFHRHLKK